MVRECVRDRVMARNSGKEREGVSGTVQWPEIARMSVRNRVMVRESERDRTERERPSNSERERERPSGAT